MRQQVVNSSRLAPSPPPSPGMCAAPAHSTQGGLSPFAHRVLMEGLQLQRACHREASNRRTSPYFDHQAASKGASTAHAGTQNAPLAGTSKRRLQFNGATHATQAVRSRKRMRVPLEHVEAPSRPHDALAPGRGLEESVGAAPGAGIVPRCVCGTVLRHSMGVYGTPLPVAGCPRPPPRYSSLWHAPKSPYDLLEEHYVEDPYKVLVVCILLNQVRARVSCCAVPTPLQCFAPHSCAVGHVCQRRGSHVTTP